MATQDDCKQRIVKIAENNVEHQYYLFNADLEPIVLSEYTISYGQTKITDDRADADIEWSFWSSLDAPGIADKITTAEKDVEFYNIIQTVMDAVDGTSVVVD